MIAVAALAIAQYVNGDDDDDRVTLDTAAEETVEANRPADDFTMTLFDGSTFTLSEQKGKVVVINFWASWCGPCKDEMPAIESIAEVSPDDVVFVGVGAKSDKDDEARAFAETYGVTYAIGRDTEGGNDLKGAIEQAYGIPGYPSTIIIDANGNISTIRIGPVTSDELQAYITMAREQSTTI